MLNNIVYMLQTKIHHINNIIINVSVSSHEGMSLTERKILPVIIIKPIHHLYPSITIFLENFPQYLYTRNSAIMISLFNNIILTLPWHVVKREPVIGAVLCG